MMPDFVRQFEIITSVIIIAVFLTLLMIETRFSLRQGKRSKKKRFLINVGVSALALATAAYVVAPVALRLASWTSENQFGLLRVMPLPFTAEFILGFLLMDLTFYYWHRANHSITFLWRFHNVHHVNPDLDVSTSFRFHFGEVLYSLGFRMLQVYLIGISLLTYVVYELIFQCATMFHHSNIRLPITLERWLNKIIVTPRMHGIHHSIVQNETNSNYSVIFRWWDLIHGTLRLNVKQSDVVIGVPAYFGPEDNKFLNLLILPFRKPREYWRLPDGKQPERSLLSGDENILVP
ncbi:MAG TPA: sterol desaturase family protein [Candidatus Binatia bacterium]|jgi:sterol desaturase/sphingolipid hydroxylase (fatty acid hydroxylase superfamily)|nr:sterol desaturase family protein [Candidatus Binatia bacterium]